MEDTSELSADWIIDPTYANEEQAQKVGPRFWTFAGNVITALTDAEIIADPTFHAEMQTKMWLLIQAERDRRKAAGRKVGNYWFHSDDPSRIQQIGLVIFGASMPTGIMWKTMAGDFVSMTPTLAGQIFQAQAVADTILFGLAEQKKAAMLLLSDPTTYDYLSGWPLVYGE